MKTFDFLGQELRPGDYVLNVRSLHGSFQVAIVLEIVEPIKRSYNAGTVKVIGYGNSRPGVTFKEAVVIHPDIPANYRLELKKKYDEWKLKNES